MANFTQGTFDPMIRAAGGFAIISGIVSAVGVVFLITMFILFAKSNQTGGETIGLLNDICVALQYMMTIPIALALYRILSPHNPSLIRTGTIIGIISMLVIVALQLALIFGILTFQQQVVWASLAMIGGVGTWLVITGIVAQSANIFPHSVLMSIIAVPYFGYPAWAFWVGRQLFGF